LPLFWNVARLRLVSSIDIFRVTPFVRSQSIPG
jgi:hypothetical protein